MDLRTIHPSSYSAQRNYKKRCQEKKIKKQKRGVTGVKCRQNDWPVLLGQWQHTADNTVIIQKWLFNPSIPLVLKPQLWGMHLSSNTCSTSHKRIFLMSTKLNESGDVHKLQPRELNTHSKSITIDYPISEPFYRFYHALLWQPTAELPLACCYSSWCGSCNSYRHTVPRQLEDSWGIPNSTRALTFWVYRLSTAVCSTSSQGGGTTE